MLMDCPTVSRFINSLQGNRIFFDPLHGNHGDRLITMAAESMFADASLALTRRPRDADLIFLNGGGSMADGWFGLRKLERYCNEYPDIPLAVLPSSFHFAKSSLETLVKGRRAPLWIWARERPSLEMLTSLTLNSSVQLGLDHDLAFSLNSHPKISGLTDTGKASSLLIVERDDWEGPTGRHRPLSLPGLDFIPEQIRTRVRRSLLGLARQRQDHASRFRTAALRYVNETHPESAGVRVVFSDISNPETGNFDDFLGHFAPADIIVSTRLHVAILGHLLKKKTYLVVGNYHKFRGVYDFSMQGGSTRLVSWNGQELVAET